MEGEQYKWRRPARVVAYVDLTIQIITAVVAVVLASVFIYTAATSKHFEWKNVLDSDDIPFDGVFFFLGFVVGILSTVSLIGATKKGVSNADWDLALRRAQIWRCIQTRFFVITIFFIAAFAVSGTFQKVVIPLVILIIVRGIFYIIVCKYIAELIDPRDPEFQICPAPDIRSPFSC